VADLIVTDPWAGLGLPFSVDGCRLDASPPGPIWSVAPYPGRISEVTAALGGSGLGFPAPGQVIAAGAARIVWAGRETAFLIGAPPPAGLEAQAALTDQSDGWAGLSLTGERSVAVLARLLPLDLRATSFPPGRSARGLLNHMPCLILRDTDAAFDLLVFRSMAGTAVHEVTDAMRGVAARAAIR
jgi:heterotetrameric sarcosine oxidase gamma subunit